jgi:hypothetical protein
MNNISEIVRTIAIIETVIGVIGIIYATYELLTINGTEQDI